MSPAELPLARPGASAGSSCSPHQPEQRYQAQYGESGEKDEALHAGPTVGHAIGVDPLHQVVAGGGDKNREPPQPSAASPNPLSGSSP